MSAPLRCALACGARKKAFLVLFPPLKRRAITSRPLRGLRTASSACVELSDAAWRKDKVQRSFWGSLDFARDFACGTDARIRAQLYVEGMVDAKWLVNHRIEA
jgi:hypothetical protein